MHYGTEVSFAFIGFRRGGGGHRLTGMPDWVRVLHGEELHGDVW